MAILRLSATAGDEVRELPSDGAALTLGRAEENSWPLQDEAASRRHAEVALTPEGWLIRDLGSSNGTWVNRTRIESRLLVDGDEIRIGCSTLVFSQPKSDAATVMVEMATPASAPPVSAAPTPPPAPPSKVPPPPPAGGPAPTPPVEEPASPSPVARTAPAAPTRSSRPEPRRPAALTSARRAPAAPSWQQKLEAVVETYTSWLAAPPATPSAAAGEAAGFVVRLGAYLIDAAILCAAMILVMVPVGLVSALIGSKIAVIGMLLSLFGWVLSMVIGFGYLLVPWALVGVTPGKKILGLKIVRSEGSAPLGYPKAALRVVGYMASGVVFCAGFVMVAFTEDHKGLHDMIADTKVVKT